MSTRFDHNRLFVSAIDREGRVTDVSLEQAQTLKPKQDVPPAAVSDAKAQLSFASTWTVERKESLEGYVGSTNLSTEKP
jgi:hypothetical protein